MSDRPRDDVRSLVGRLYDTYGASLYRYAVLLLADAAAAEDVVQQVFAAILRQTPRLEEEAHYLRRAIRNACYSQLPVGALALIALTGLTASFLPARRAARVDPLVALRME